MHRNSWTNHIGEADGEYFLAAWPPRLLGRGDRDQGPWFPDGRGIHAFLFRCGIPVVVTAKRRTGKKDDRDVFLSARLVLPTAIIAGDSCKIIGVDRREIFAI